MPLVSKKYILLFCFVFGIAIPLAVGQDSIPQYNPFELQDRLPPEEKVEKPVKEQPEIPAEEVEDTVEKIIGNPFDLPDNQGVSGEETVSETGLVGQEKPEVQPWKPELPDFGEGKAMSDFWIGIYILMLVIILAILNTFFIADVRKTFRAFISENMLNLSFRQLGEYISNFAFLLNAFYLLCGGLFIFLIVNHFNFAGLGYNVTTFALSLGFLVLVSFLRHILLVGVGAIFSFGKEINLYRHTINIFDYVTGFILFPLVVCIAFAPNNISGVAVLISIGVIFLIYIFRSLRGLSIGVKYLSFHKFHFFLYLCTVEIAPLVVVVKLLTIWGSAV